VGMWRFVDKKGKHPARSPNLQNVGIYSKINGGDLPAQIWHDYMTQALSMNKYKDVTQFSPPAYVGNTDLTQTPPPSATPTPSNTPTPTCRPNQTPEIDHCRPDPNGDPPNCSRFPGRPQCQTHQPTKPPTCNPVLGCHSTPPNEPGGGNGGKGQQTQQRAARPLDD